MSGVDSDLIRGHIDTIILKVLSEGDKYGYEICKDVEEKSGGTYELKQPTLYSCLKRLESQGLISSYWEDSDIGGKRHYYKLTEQGKEAYRKNQEEWLRSRQIIDNLISNSKEIASSYSLVKTEEIEELEKKVEQAEISEEIKNKDIDEDVSENKDENVINPSPIKFEEEEIIPWGANNLKDEEQVKQQESQNVETNEEETIYSWNRFVDMSNEEQKILVEVAPNGEETAAYVEDIELVEQVDSPNQLSDDNLEQDNEEVSPAQSSIFEDEEVVFEEENLNQDEEVDILELLGHTSKSQIEHNQEELIEYKEEPQLEYSDELKIEHNQEILIEHKEEPMLEYSEKETTNDFEEETEPVPFSFNMDDFVTKSRNSYFDSEEDVTPDYIAPTMKVDSLEEKTESFDFDEFVNKHTDNDDEIYNSSTETEEEKETEDESYSTPVYHDFGASSLSFTINGKKQPDDDDIYVDTSDVSDDEIYLNPNEAKNDNDDELKLFTEDIFEENNLFESNEEVEESNGFVNFENEEIIRPAQENKEPMEFYKSTENYDAITPKFTEDEYKEKISSLMSYTNDKEQYDLKEASYTFDNKPKDYLDLKNEFEKEGLVVRTHHKMVKESRHTRSYVESNKLNLVNSWTAFGFVSFLITLTYLIMSNYANNVKVSYNFSVKYFLYGILILAVIPALYTILFFINPYKKKPARYASRIYLLFAILLTVQFLLIIYCVNLQAGFYSFSQANYNHLYWVIPSLMSLYPLFDAVLHTIYFNSRNFHV